MTTKNAFSIAVVLGLGTGLALTLYGTAEAGRNASGTYTSPSSSFVTETVISSSVMNGKLDDIGTEITDSLSRSGKGGMLARMRGVDGTSALPAYSFTSETTLGMYRAGSSDLRISDDGTDIAKFTPTGITLYQATTTEKGLTVTNSTTNGAGTTSTGNGTGAGVVSTGGASGAVGGVFTGTVNNVAGSFQGHGTAAGISSAGGATGPGVSAVGGVTSGVGGTFSAQAGNSAGIAATGHGTAVGGLFAAGTAATVTDPTNAVELTNGNLKLSGTPPNPDESLSNTLTPANTPKAWATIDFDNDVTPTVLDGYNITSVAVVGNDLVVTLGGDFSNTTYAVSAITDSAVFLFNVTSKATGTTTFNCFNPIVDDSDVDCDSFSGNVDIIWVGRQP
jgi:hypothetical protein